MTTPNLELPEVPEAILGASDEINEGFWALDVVVQLSVADKDLNIPPATAPQGVRYIVPTGGTGPWIGKDRSIAYLSPQGWRFYRPRLGWIAYVEDEDLEYRYDGEAWIEVEAGGTPPPNELDVLTTQGDLLTKNADSPPAYVRLPRGANGQALFSDDTEPEGLVWRYPAAGGGSVPLPTDARVNFLRLRYTMTGENVDGPSWSAVAATNVIVNASNSSSPLLANQHRRIRTNTAATGNASFYVNNIDNGPVANHAYPNRAGFSYQFIGGIDSLMSDGTSRFYIGMQSATGTPANADPSGLTNFVALAADTADANAQFMHNDGSGTCTKINVGVTKASLVGKLLVFTMICPLGGGQVDFSLYVVDDDVEYTATATTNLPAAGACLIPRNFVNDTINAETGGLIFIDVLCTWSYGVPAGV